MLKSYEAIYENGQLSWLGIKPKLNKAKVIVVIDEDNSNNQQSIKHLKGIVPKLERVISLEEMDNAIELEGENL
jgi:hypothetical protein